MCICPILQLHTCSEAVKPSDRQNASLAREQSIRSCSTSTEPSAELSVFILKQIYREKKSTSFDDIALVLKWFSEHKNIYFSVWGTVFNWTIQRNCWFQFYFFLSPVMNVGENHLFLSKRAWNINPQSVNSPVWGFLPQQVTCYKKKIYWDILWLQQSNFFLIYLFLYTQCLSNSVIELPSLILHNLFWGNWIDFLLIFLNIHVIWCISFPMEQNKPIYTYCSGTIIIT